MADSKKTALIEKIAAVSAGVIIISAVVYWTIQIVEVLEFLEMAYG